MDQGQPPPPQPYPNQDDQQQYQSHQQHPMHQGQQAPAYGYAIDPQWGQIHQGYHPGYGYQYPLQHMEGVPLPPGIPGLGGSTDPLEAVLGPFPCARLKNLPYDATLEDILLLFQGLVVIDVVLVGQGDAYVIFANPMDFQMALQRDRQVIGRRFIEVSAASRADYYDAIATQHLQEQEGARQLSAASASADERGGDEQKPSGETASTVAALWGGAAPNAPVPALPGQPVFAEGLAHHAPPAPPAPGRGGGGSSRPASAGSGGGSASSSGSGGGGASAQPPLQKRTGGGVQVGEHTGFLRMRGLPFSASKEDVFKFFDGYNPVQETIVLTYRNDGRATGEAYVGFASPNDSKRAMELHRRTMGSRYIELFISNKDEQSRAFARFGNR